MHFHWKVFDLIQYDVKELIIIISIFSRGEVLSILPLVPDDIQNIVGLNGIENLCLVAMATVSKVIVISLKPNLFVHFTYLLKVRLFV